MIPGTCVNRLTKSDSHALLEDRSTIALKLLVDGFTNEEYNKSVGSTLPSKG